MEHPEGLDIEQIRMALSVEGQQHLDKRVRELYPHFNISRGYQDGRYVYRYLGIKESIDYDYSTVNKTLRAKVLHRDGQRCQMCGRTVVDDNVKLHVDHKIPREWGGVTDEGNLWALCSGCNEGKKNYFASLNASEMRKILSHKSVHRRIAEALKLRIGEWVDADFLEFVANFQSWQSDWRKRLRELRYLGLDIKSKRRKVGRRSVSYYRIKQWTDLPTDPTAAARAYERARSAAKKS